MIVLTPAFRRDYRRLSSEVQKRVEEGIEGLAACEDPRRLGHKLQGRWKGLCSHEIGLQYRMIFRTDPERRTIEFLAIGTRKVYL